MTFQLTLGDDFNFEKFNNQNTTHSGPAVEHSGYRWNLVYVFYERNRLRSTADPAPGVWLVCQRISQEPVRSWSVEVLCPETRTQKYRFDEESKKEANLEYVHARMEFINKPYEIRIIKIKEHKNVDFVSPQDHTNAVLVVEGKEFHVSKQSLASYCTFFKNLFFPITDQFRYTLEDITAVQLQDFLEVLYHFSDLTGKNITNVITLCQRFEARSLFKMGLQAIRKMPDSEFPLNARIQLGDSNGLDVLIHSTLQNCTTLQEVQSALPANLNELKPENTLLLLQKMKDVNLMK